MIQKLRLILVCLALIALSAPSYAVIEQVQFDTVELDQRYKSLIAEFRCLVCQNQNLADSNAELAKDLRRKTAEMLRDGSSNDDIRQYMRDRYGDFVTYKPAYGGRTAFLWFGPVLLLLLVIIALIIRIRRRQNDEILKPAKANDEAKMIKARNLLQDAPDLKSSRKNQD